MKNSFSAYWSGMGYDPLDVFSLLHQKSKIKKPRFPEMNIMFPRAF